MGNLKKQQSTLLAALLLTPSLLMAQPIEESQLPPVTVPEMEIEIIDPTQAEVDPFPTDTDQTQQNQIITPIFSEDIKAVEPVVAPEKVEKVESPAEEDDTLKNVTISPALTLQPIATMGENAFFFEFNPSLGISTNVKTGNGQKVSLNGSYGFILDEFLSKKDSNSRYFEHAVSGGMGIAWNDVISTDISGSFGYYINLGAESHEVDSANKILVGFQINPMIKAQIGYGLYYYNNVGGNITRSTFGLPSDSDDIFVNNIAFGDSSFSDPFGFSGAPISSDTWFANHSVNTKASIKATKTTGFSLGYDYVFATGTNNQDTAWTGHWIVAGVSQTMPWKGGSAGLTSQLRIRGYNSATNGDGSSKTDWRSRTWFTYSQQINKFISADLWYRLQVTGVNDPAEQSKAINQLRIGMTVGF